MSLYKPAPKEVLEARPYSTSVAQYVAKLAGEKFPDKPADMGTLIGSIAFQTLIVAALVDITEPGSAEGEKMINQLYEAARKDAVQRWHEQDLKHHFGKKS